MNLFGPTSENSIAKPFRFWVIWVAGIVSLGAIAIGTYFFSLSGELTEIKTLARSMTRQPLTTVSSSRQGGDIDVSPPFVFPPVLPVLTGTLLPKETFTAKSILVKDTRTGMLLYNKEPYAQVPIASITKLMSAILIAEHHPDWTKTATVESADLFDTHIISGKAYSFETLWHAALISSSNRAIATLASHVGYTTEEFALQMNNKARELGMTGSHFFEPTGLAAENYGTASDLLLLLNEALKTQSIQDMLLTPEDYILPENEKKSDRIWNTNWLLLNWIPHTIPKVLGGKTGYIPESGYNFVVRVEDDEGHAIDIAILGATSHEARFTEARDIAMWTFANYTWPDELGI